jgi:hypothetical protein
VKRQSGFFLVATLMAVCLFALSFLTPICVAACAQVQCTQIGAGTAGGAIGDPCWLTTLDGSTYQGYDYALGHAGMGYGSVPLPGFPGTAKTGSYCLVTGTLDCPTMASSGSVTILTHFGYSDSYQTECLPGGS